jgi:cytidine deaminase
MSRVIEMSSKITLCKIKDLLPIDKVFLLAAQEARRNAQAPYSNFKVGAAVSCSDTIFTGVNVERCTYTQTTHAEQNAIDSMVATLGPAPLKAVAVCIIDPNDDRDLDLEEINLNEVAFPCGHCLQIIWENCDNQNVQIFTMVTNKIVAMASISDLLPVRFGPTSLGVNVFCPDQ